MAKMPNVRLELDPSEFDVMMAILADNAASAPYERDRSGAEDLMEKRMRFSRLYTDADGYSYVSVRMYEKEAAEMIWQLLSSADFKYEPSEEYHKKLRDGGGGHD